MNARGKLVLSVRFVCNRCARSQHKECEVTADGRVVLGDGGCWRHQDGLLYCDSCTANSVGKP